MVKVALRAHGISARDRVSRARPRRPRVSVAERFWSKVGRRGSSECWPWLGRVHKRGYGVFALDGRRRVGAHVFAFELSGGSVAAGYHVHHDCEARLCCNPAHMRLLSPAEHTAFHNRARAAEDKDR